MNQFPNQEEQINLADQDAVSENGMQANFSHNQDIPEPKFWKHKLFWPFLVVVGVFIWFGGSYVYKSITEGVSYELPDWLSEQLSPLNDNNLSIEELKKLDTDSDGLNNYQEIYQFHTSIFLEDSDSDGISDLAEVSSGEDPLCPRGQDCNLLRLITPDTKLGEVIRDIQVDQSVTLQQAAIAEFRKFLVENGMSKEEVDLLTDEDLIAVFSAIDESQPNEAVDLGENAGPDEIRAFLLVQEGADAEEINRMTDEQLFQVRDTLINLGNR